MSNGKRRSVGGAAPPISQINTQRASRPDPADPDTWKNNWPDHLAGAYIDSGMVNQAADFVAGRI